MNIEKAIQFVEKNGTPIDKYRLRFLLGKKRNDEVPLRHLRDLQNADGGFPYNDEKGKASCVSNAASCLDMLIGLGLTNSDVFEKTVDHLLRIQNEDGSWSENEEISKYDPPFWDLPRDLKTSMWLTADITNFLILAGYKDSRAMQRAAGFLLGNRDEEGRFTGYLHSTWISIGVFGQLKGSESEIVKKALNVIDKNLAKLDEGTVLAWCLECFYVAGLVQENPIVRKCIDKLVSLQQENGAWLSSDGEKFAVTTTLSALKALKKYKLW